MAVARGLGRGPGEVGAGGRLQGALLVQPHTLDAEHGAAGQAPRAAGAGARLPLPCPPPAGHPGYQRRGPHGSGCGPPAPPPSPLGQPGKSRAHLSPRTHTTWGVPGRPGGAGTPSPRGSGREALPCSLGSAGVLGGGAGSPGRAGLLAALLLPVVGPAQGVAVSLVHGPRLPLRAVCALPLHTWGRRARLSLSLARGAPHLRCPAPQHKPTPILLVTPRASPPPPHQPPGLHLWPWGGAE